jgi:hypothetical protein
MLKYILAQLILYGKNKGFTFKLLPQHIKSAF